MARGQDVDENGNPLDPTADPNDPTPGGSMNSGITRQQVIDWYQKYNGRPPESEDIIQGWMHNPQGAAAVEDAIKNSPEAKAFAAGPAAAPPPPAPPPGGTGGTGGNGVGDFPAFDKPWTQPTWAPTPDAPTFTAPVFKTPPVFSFADFTPTTATDLTTDPGYQVRTDRGIDALKRSGAMRGITNTGMNLRDILDYGQQSASQEFQNVDARRRTDYGLDRDNAVGTYNTNYQTQYLDPYKFTYQGALDTFNPSFDAWKTNAGNTQRTNEFNTSNSLRQWEDEYNQYLNYSRDKWGRAKDVLGA